MFGPLLIIHVPKTAGTSLRVAMETYLGESAVVADYGLQAPQTHQLVRDYFYESNDLYGLYAGLLASTTSSAALMGHFEFNRYASLFSLCNVIVFVREPLSRLFSEYQHFVRVMNYEGTLNEFIKKRRLDNIQSRYLSGVPLSALGFLGISEDYPDAVSLINAKFDLALPTLSLNCAPDTDFEVSTVSEEDRALFSEFNQQDILLYERATKIYQTLKNLHKNGEPFTHGEYELDEQGVISGFAFQSDNVSPISLNIEVEGRVVAEVEAKEMSYKLRILGAPRKGYVGFQYRLDSTLLKSESIAVREKKTGQLLFAGEGCRT